jgi:transcriptional regulator with XRE-family HTH domain
MNSKETKRLRLKQVSESIKSHELFPAQEIGRKIADVRQALGMSQSQLAKKIGISQQALNKLENRGALSSIETIEKALRPLDIALNFSLNSKESLLHKVDKRALEKAGKLVDRTEAGMAMELQQPHKAGRRDRIKKLAEKFSSMPGRSLWDDA